jgi:hypothetical protein
VGVTGIEEDEEEEEEEESQETRWNDESIIAKEIIMRNRK